MPTLPTLPRHTWLERVLYALAGAQPAIGLAALAGWWLHLETLYQPGRTTPRCRA